MLLVSRASTRDPLWRLAARISLEVSLSTTLARPLCAIRLAIDAFEEIERSIGPTGAASILDDLLDRISPAVESDLIGPYNGAGLLLLLPVGGGVVASAAGVALSDGT